MKNSEAKDTDNRIVADMPVANSSYDTLQMGSCAKSLEEYIRKCATPMTIAVQGDWGSGKTSMLNMIWDNLQKTDQIVCISFNTWQYSQFEMSEDLPITFLEHFLKEIHDIDRSKPIQAVGNALNTIKDIALIAAKNGAIFTAGLLGGDDCKDMLRTTIGVVRKNETQADLIKELREQLDDCIQALIENKKKDRVVVFLDDLDRLNPVRAVELLEVIKLFLDCKNCVFVMAVDTSVVKQGIVRKYELSEEKSQAFFDKLIQLPFIMPVDQFKYKDYIGSIFIENEYVKNFYQKLEGDKDKCCQLLWVASDKNLRAVKRVVNAFALKTMIVDEKNIEKKDSDNSILILKKILLVLTCIQSKLEVDYRIIIEQVSYWGGFRKWLVSDDIIKVDEKSLGSKWGYSAKEIDKYYKDKENNVDLIDTFKLWCREYIKEVEEGKKLQEWLISSDNGKNYKQRTNISAVAKIVVDNFQIRLRELRRKSILDMLMANKENEEWYKDAVLLLEQGKDEDSHFSYQDISDKIITLSQILEEEGVEEEKVLSITELHENIDNLKFKVGYVKMVEDTFLSVVGENLERGFRILKERELRIENWLQIQDILSNTWHDESMLLNRTYQARNKIFQYIYALWRKKSYEIETKLDEEKKDIYVEVEDEILERMRYFFTKLRNRSKGKMISIDNRPLPSVFSVAALLDNANEEKSIIDIVQQENWDRGWRFHDADAIWQTEFPEDRIYKSCENKILQADVEKMQSIYDDLREIFMCEEEEFKQIFGWIEEELKEFEQKKEDGFKEGIPQGYEKKRLRWYFGITTAIAYYEKYGKKDDQITKMRDFQKEPEWRRIYNAVDIIQKEWLDMNNQDSDKVSMNSSMFWRITEEAVNELNEARDNRSGWQYDDLPMDFLNRALEEIRKFLENIMDQNNYDSRNSYDLGVLIGLYFDEDAYPSDLAAKSCGVYYRDDQEIYIDQCCFEKREATLLWRYYIVFAKVINQLRLYNSELYECMKPFSREKYRIDDPYEDWYCFANAERGYEALKDVANEYSHALVNRKLISKYDDIKYEEVAKCMALDKTWFANLLEYMMIRRNVIEIYKEMPQYYVALGNLMYRYIPEFIEYADSGKVPEATDIAYEESRRQERFRKKYQSVLEWLYSIAQRKE